MAGTRADGRIDCQLCTRTVNSQTPFCCTSCAKNVLYDARLKQAQMLLRKEALAREVERAIKDGEELYSQKQDAVTAAPAARVAYDQTRAERAEVKLAIRATEQHVQALKDELLAAKAEMTARRTTLIKRRQMLEAGKSEMARQDLRREPVQHSITKTERRETSLHEKTLHARGFVCQQAAKLYNLQRKKRKKGNEERDVFYILGLPVVDLQDLFNAKVEPLNASLVNITYLLNQTAAYLSVRLPAEIFLPCAEHAEPRILAPHSSHRQPAITPSKRLLSSSGHTIADVSAQAWAPSRPRSLRLGQPLSRLFAEDNVAYESFVEAVSLLAYNVAWLLKSQGMDVCRASSEEACYIGRNLWLLLSDESDARTRILSHVLGENWHELAGDVKLGVFSHGTHRNFAAGVEGNQIGFKTWRLANATQVIKKVKDVLMERRMGAEWEVLEEDAWGPSEDIAGKAAAEDVRQTDTDNEKSASDKNGKGWMRIRSRNGEGPSA